MTPRREPCSSELSCMSGTQAPLPCSPHRACAQSRHPFLASRYVETCAPRQHPPFLPRSDLGTAHLALELTERLQVGLAR